MEDKARELFERLLRTPSPSGSEARIQSVVKEYVEGFADEVRLDVHGNLFAGRNVDASRRIMFAGHCDQIGLIVHYIDDDGFLWFKTVGGWDPIQLIGQRVVVWSRDGAVPGVVARKPIHLLSEDERKEMPKLEDLWIDIGASGREEAAQAVRVGDWATFELEIRKLPHDRWISPGMDDKTGLFVVLEALRRLDAERLDWAVWSVSTVQEEIGLRGARTASFGLDPEIGIAVDVTHATDCPTVEKKKEGDVKVGGGPVVHRGPNVASSVAEGLVAAAAARSITIQMAADGRATPTDANAIQVNRAGVAAGLVSIPNRYMHSSVEMISLDDLDRAADLLAELAMRLAADEILDPAAG